MDDEEQDAHEVKNAYKRRMYALAQLMLSLNGDGVQELYDASGPDSQVFANEVTRLASDFADEWAKVPDDVHEELDEDYVEEMDALADWMRAHAADIMENSLEYGLYRAGRPKFSMVVEDLSAGMTGSNCEVTTSEKKELIAQDASRAWEEMLNQAFISNAIGAIRSGSGSSEMIWRDSKVFEAVERDKRGIVFGHRRYRLEMEKEELG